MAFQLSSAPAPAPPPETDVSLLERLRAGIEHGQVTLALDFKRLRQGDSPVNVQADANRWFIGSAVAVAVSWLGTSTLTAVPGWMVGGPVLAVAVTLYVTVARKYVNERIERRVHTLSLKDVAEWRKLWRFGGVALRRGTNTTIPECRAPDGNWFDFVRRLPPAPRSRN